MKVEINDIRKKCEKIFTNNGVKPKNAKIIVDDYIEGELLGKKSHGLNAFINNTFSRSELKKYTNGSKIKTIKNKGVFALINGNGQAGQLVAEIAKKLIIKKAKKYGIGIVGTYKATALLRPGSQAESIARHNLIALIFHNGGGPMVAPYGGIDPIIGTNPIGYAIPTTKLPIVADMAISERAWREVGLAKLSGKDLPKNSFINKKGEITLDPDEVFAALPFGGYKGYALSILSEILSSSLVNTKTGKNKEYYKKNDRIKTYRGAFYIAIDPTKFVNLKKFKEQNTSLINQLKKSKKRKGITEILVPGERAYKQKEKNLKRGWFDVDKKIIDKMDEIFATL